MQTLHGRRVLVTGATGRWGQPVVEALLAVGAQVIAGARRRTRLDALRAELLDHDRLEVAEVDITRFSGVDQLMAEVAASGGLHGVVHCAVRRTEGTLEALAEAEIASMVDTNVLGTLAVLRSAVSHIAEEGSIVLLSGAAAPDLRAKPGVFSVTQAATAAAARAAIAAGQKKRIRVNSISPGFVDRPSSSEAPPSFFLPVAKTAVWLLGSESSGTCGAVLPVAG